MAENKMAQVAEMFGKQLNEEFIVVFENREKDRCKITEDGVELYDPYYEMWVENDLWLKYLLKGKAEILEGEDDGRE